MSILASDCRRCRGIPDPHIPGCQDIHAAFDFSLRNFDPGLDGFPRLFPCHGRTVCQIRGPEAQLTPDELPEVQGIVRELAKRADLPGVPHLYHVPSRMLNAFAVGSREDSALALTDGLLRSMNLRELAGILAHEISHIRSGDLRVMALADVLTRLTNLMSLIGLIGIPAFLGAGLQIPWVGLLLLVLAPTIGGLLQLGLSRTREYDADFEGAALTGDPEGLASALLTLDRKQGNVWEGLFPGGRIPDPSLLRTHPRTEDRIRRLMSLAPSSASQVTVAPGRPRPGPSVIPPVGDPRVHWPRMGIWY